MNELTNLIRLLEIAGIDGKMNDSEIEARINKILVAISLLRGSV